MELRAHGRMRCVIVGFVVAMGGCVASSKSATVDGDDAAREAGSSSTCPEHPNVMPLEGFPGTCQLRGVIETSLTLDAAHAWLLTGVYVGDPDPCAREVSDTGVVLNIEPGTTLYGDTSADSFLVISRGARIEAVGTATDPIVFTSSRQEGQRRASDWKGVVLQGRAPVAAPGNPDVPYVDDQATGCFGGSQPHDDSGTLRYVRIEFAGAYYLEAGFDGAGLALDGVGDGTVVSHVQVHASGSDGVAVRGGTVQLDHLIVSEHWDDGLSWVLPWAGGASHAIVRAPRGSDTGIQGGIVRSRAAEDETRATPTLKHLTLVASSDPPWDTEVAMAGHAISLRDVTHAAVEDVLATGYERCLHINGRQAVQSIERGEIRVTDALLDCSWLYLQRSQCVSLDEWAGLEDASPCPESGLLGLEDVTGPMLEAGGNLEAAVDLVDPLHPTRPRFAAKAGSTSEGRGALVDGDWTQGWSAYPRN